MLRTCLQAFIPILKNKITRQRAEDSTNSTGQTFVGALAPYKIVRVTRRRANAVRLFFRMGIIMPVMLVPALLIIPVHAAPPLYICQHGGKAVYTSYPKKLPQGRCQPSALQEAEPTAATPTDDPIRDFWYRLEFGHIDAQTPILPPPPPARPSTTVNNIATSTMPPAPLSRRQLIERDIAAEKNALQQAQRQLSQAQQSAQTAGILAWRGRVADHLQNLRALEEELKRY